MFCRRVCRTRASFNGIDRGIDTFLGEGLEVKADDVDVDNMTMKQTIDVLEEGGQHLVSLDIEQSIISSNQSTVLLVHCHTNYVH